MFVCVYWVVLSIFFHWLCDLSLENATITLCRWRKIKTGPIASGNCAGKRQSNSRRHDCRTWFCGFRDRSFCGLWVLCGIRLGWFISDWETGGRWDLGKYGNSEFWISGFVLPGDQTIFKKVLLSIPTAYPSNQTVIYEYSATKAVSCIEYLVENLRDEVIFSYPMVIICIPAISKSDIRC